MVERVADSGTNAPLHSEFIDSKNSAPLHSIRTQTRNINLQIILLFNELFQYFSLTLSKAISALIRYIVFQSYNYCKHRSLPSLISEVYRV